MRAAVVRLAVLASLASGAAGCKEAPGRSDAGPTPLRAAQPRVLPSASVSVSASATATQRAASSAAPAVIDPMAQSAYSGSWTVRASDGRQVVQLSIAEELATVRYGEHTLSSTHRTGSRRYQLDGDGGYLAKVKRRGPRIRLRGKGGDTLWSAALDGTSVKLSHPEQGSYLIQREGDAVRVERDGKTLGRARHDRASGKVSVRDDQGALRFAGEADRATALWLLPLLSDIPEPQRYILMAELAARGR